MKILQNSAQVFKLVLVTMSCFLLGVTVGTPVSYFIPPLYAGAVVLILSNVKMRRRLLGALLTFCICLPISLLLPPMERLFIHSSVEYKPTVSLLSKFRTYAHNTAELFELRDNVDFIRVAVYNEFDGEIWLGTEIELPPEGAKNVTIDNEEIAQEVLQADQCTTIQGNPAIKYATELVTEFHDGWYSDSAVNQIQNLSGQSVFRIRKLLGDEIMVGDDEQYTSAFAYLMRERGYEARIILGFTVQDSQVFANKITAYNEVKTDEGWCPYYPSPRNRYILDGESAKKATEEQERKLSDLASLSIDPYEPSDVYVGVSGSDSKPSNEDTAENKAESAEPPHSPAQFLPRTLFGVVVIAGILVGIILLPLMYLAFRMRYRNFGKPRRRVIELFRELADRCVVATCDKRGLLAVFWSLFTPATHRFSKLSDYQMAAVISATFSGEVDDFCEMYMSVVYNQDIVSGDKVDKMWGQIREKCKYYAIIKRYEKRRDKTNNSDRGRWDSGTH
jgi:hypothetical protein